MGGSPASRTPDTTASVAPGPAGSSEAPASLSQDSPGSGALRPAGRGGSPALRTPDTQASGAPVPAERAGAPTSPSLDTPASGAPVPAGRDEISSAPELLPPPFCPWELCWIFCCPPWPSCIAAKLAFHPPKPSYSLQETSAPREGQQKASAPGDEDSEHGEQQAPALGKEEHGSISGKQQQASAPGKHELTSASENGKKASAPAKGKKKQTLESPCTIQLTTAAFWPHSTNDLAALELFWTTTARGNRLACMLVHCAPGARYTLLFSQPNAVDLGRMCDFYVDLGSDINCNIFSYDYSGYGASSGQASEENLYADIEAAWEALQTHCKVDSKDIILYGQSIGTVPTIDLATRHECAAVILHAPLMSALRVAFPNIKKTYCFDTFCSIDKIANVKSPVLVIHGTEDQIIDISHGIAMYEHCPQVLEPLWVKGADHNNINMCAQYLRRLKHLISHELPNS